MKKLSNCQDENCIPTPSSCINWNGGDVSYLGICDGDPLNNLMWEVITKLQDITGNDLSSFDIDTLADICNNKAPNEITLISILNLLKNNQVCLKEFIDTLDARLNEIFANTSVKVNLSCYAQFDNIGNSLSITREQLDQLIINNLCEHKGRIETLEGKIINIQSQIDNINSNTTVDELNFSTCVDPVVKPTSSQVVSIANAHCDLETATGNTADISAASANFPSSLPTEIVTHPDWILAPANQAELLSNAYLVITNLLERVNIIENTCCAPTCDLVKVGFSAIYNEDGDGVILRFTAGAGTSIPVGWEDGGSTVTITDIDGNSVDANIEISNNAEEEVIITGLNTLGELNISINVIIQTEGLVCQKCVSKKVKPVQQCAYCTLTATGTTGTIVIVYEAETPYGSSDGGVIEVDEIEDDTTTTTTTTEGV